MADFGLSAFAMFFMQSASFLSFQRKLEKGQGRSNCQSLFGIEKIPSDNYIRDMLDGADPALLAPCFHRAEQLLLEPAMREAFGRLGDRTLIALDGTEYFCSQKIACPHCQTRKRSNGKVESYHSLLCATVVAPGHSKVVPLAPEFIVKQDGAEKQDCERNAVKRWLDQHAARLKPLRPVIWPTISSPVRAWSSGFRPTATISASPARRPRTRRSTTSSMGPNSRVMKSKCAKASCAKPIATGSSRRFLCATARTPCGSIGSASTSSNAKGEITYRTAFVTSLPVAKSNAAEIAVCGRARWKIENEGFNVLKNNGYELEHNFGHGESYLAMTLAALNLLAFAWHTVLDLLAPPWQKAREAAEKRMSFFAYLATLTSLAIFPAWSDLIRALTTFTIPPHLLTTQKLE